MSGLEGVVAAETAMSRVDGQRGELVLRGYRLDQLAGRVPFEHVAALLWFDDLDRGPEVRERLGAARVDLWERLRVPRLPDVMDTLRAALAGLDDDDPAVITAAVAVALARWADSPNAPSAHRGHAEDLEHLLGLRPGLDTYLSTVVDHGLNASTFTARVIASTASDRVSAVVGALGALKGPLHGGAPGPVLDMLDAIGDGDADAWIEAELAAGRRIMGMGHRVYRVRDPRAAVLEGAVGSLAGDRVALARRVEAAARRVLARRYPDRGLFANVEFYTAVLLEALGVPREMFTGVFAAARVVGWLAHIDEQRRTGRLIRPSSRYVGPEPLPGTEPGLGGDPRRAG